MINAAAAALRLANIQVFGRKRRVVTVLVFLLPIVLGLLMRNFGPDNKSQAYAQVISGMLAIFVIPFVAVFWGSAILTDEIEGKTLVFLWTRPVGRSRLFVMKYLAIVLWLFALGLCVTLLTYLVIYIPWPLNAGMGELFGADAQMILWDARALALGGATYGALAFFFATLFKKALTFALIYVYTFDGIATFMPGFLQRLSIRYHILTLTSHPDTEKPQGILKLINQSATTETQAMMTLVIAAAILIVCGSLIMRNKEYLSDDPARGQ